MPKQTARFVLAAFASLLLFVLVGFRVGTSSPRLGVYAMSIVAEDIPASVPVEARNNFTGKWQMTFAKENGYQISRDGKVLVEGHLTSSTAQVKFKDERGDLACTQEPEMETGIYEFSYQDNELTFKLVDDKCEGRRFVLTVHSWLKETQSQATSIQGPPPLKPTPTEDTARYVAWMEKQGKPITDGPHEDVFMRLGDWGFFYHGERPVGSFSPPRDRTALDRSSHVVTEAENTDWFALLSNGLDATQALKRVAWLFNADGLLPGEGQSPTDSDASLQSQDHYAGDARDCRSYPCSLGRIGPELGNRGILPGPMAILFGRDAKAKLTTVSKRR